VSRRFPGRWLTERIFAVVEVVMPRERGEWARAMRAEAAHLGSASTAMSFAGECLWAALVEYSKVEISRSAALISAGLAGGFVFIAHSAIEGSGAWPLLWPLLGGAMAGWLTYQGKQRVTFRRGLWVGLKAGMLAGLLFAVAGAAIISWSGRVPLDSRFDILALGASLGAILSMTGAGGVTLLTRMRMPDGR